jgi:FkbM family methyltransferase
MGLVRRLNWYKARLQVNNRAVGRIVELTGNRVRMDGLTFSVDCPQISTEHKSTLVFGLHEMEERKLIKRWLPGHVPVLEFGGGIGVVSCLVNSKLANPNRHIVLEANPEMIAILYRNREINRAKFKIINRAIAYGCDYIDLNIDSEFVGSSVLGASTGKAIKVRATNISSLLEEANFADVGIVCDIEGAENDIINSEIPALKERIKYFMIEMHTRILGEHAVRKLLDKLCALGFTLKEQIGDNVFFVRD